MLGTHLYVHPEIWEFLHPAKHSIFSLMLYSFDASIRTRGPQETHMIRLCRGKYIPSERYIGCDAIWREHVHFFIDHKRASDENSPFMPTASDRSNTEVRTSMRTNFAVVVKNVLAEIEPLRFRGRNALKDYGLWRTWYIIKSIGCNMCIFTSAWKFGPSSFPK